MCVDGFDRDLFIESNLGLVHSLCKRFVGKGIEYDDLYQAGCMGLVKASDAFDRERGLCFSTYAVPVILGEIKRLFRDGGAVKISRGIKELGLKTAAEKQKFEQRLGREPTVSELAEALGVTSEEVTEAVCAMQPTVSLTYNTEDMCEVNGEDELTNRLLVSSALEYLTENERQIVKYRFYNSLTQSKTAEKLSMTQVQVSRAEKRLLGKLREIISR